MKHEMELKRLKEQETVEKKTKGLALKASVQTDISEEKMLNMMKQSIYLQNGSTDS